MDDKREEYQHSNMKSERRIFKRISGSYVISYAHLEGNELKFDLSQTKNLSEGGLLFIADRAFKEGAILKIKLRLPEFPDYVMAKLQIIASQKLLIGNMYGVRGKFVEMEQKVKDSIKRLAEHGQ